MTDMKFDGFDDYNLDPDLESGSGVDLEYGEKIIRIHRAGGSNRKYERIYSAKLKPHRRKLQLGTIEPELLRRIQIEAFAEAVVVGWSGIKSGGVDVPFSASACVDLFNALPELFDDVQRAAGDISLFRKEVKEADEKNSVASSVGETVPAA